MSTLETSACVVYRNGLVHCSVCAPAKWTAAMVEQEVDEINPTGLDHRWAVSQEATFKDGEPNPCPCSDPAADRQHWLMVC